MSEEDKLVHLETYLNPYQAEMVRGLLESNDIQCYIENNHVNTTMWHLQHALGGTRIMVLSSNLEKSQDILHNAKDSKIENSAPWLPETKGGIFRMLLSFLLTLLAAVPTPLKKK